MSGTLRTVPDTRESRLLTCQYFPTAFYLYSIQPRSVCDSRIHCNGYPGECPNGATPLILLGLTRTSCPTIRTDPARYAVTGNSYRYNCQSKTWKLRTSLCPTTGGPVDACAGLPPNRQRFQIQFHAGKCHRRTKCRPV